MSVVTSILVKLFFLYNMLSFHLQSSPLKQANVLFYHTHFTDEKIEIQGSWEFALTLVTQPEEAWSKTDPSPTCRCSDFLPKAPLLHPVFMVHQVLLQKLEEARLQQEL